MGGLSYNGGRELFHNFCILTGLRFGCGKVHYGEYCLNTKKQNKTTPPGFA